MIITSKDAEAMLLLQKEATKNPIDSQSAIMLFGLDLKITPEGNVKLIEVNGINSGTSGFEEHYDHLVENPKDEILKYFKEQLGSAYPYVALRLEEFRQWSPYFRQSDVVLREGHLFDAELREHFFKIHDSFEEKYDDIVKQIIIYTRLVDYKPHMDQLDDIRFYRNKSYSTYNEIGAAKHELAEKLVIVKPEQGLCSEGVKVCHIDEVIQREDFIVEEFVHSKPIYCDQTGAYHDGCMRIPAIAVMDEEEVSVSVYDGYWRLALEPQNPNHFDNLNSIACYSRDKLTAPASRSDIKKATQAALDIIHPLMCSMEGIYLSEGRNSPLWESTILDNREQDKKYLIQRLHDTL